MSNPISDCTTIDSSGVYHLTGGITAPANETCIFINASDVVFDGNGHLIKGNGSGANHGHPIAVEDSSDISDPSDGILDNVTIRNVRIANWSQSVFFSEVDNATVEDVIIRDTFHIAGTGSGTGLAFFRGSNQEVIDSRLVDVVGRGIDVTNTRRTVIARTTIRNAGGQAILLFGDSGHIVRDNTVENSFKGIYSPSQSFMSDILVENNTVRSTTRNGIRIRSTRNGSILRNTVTGSDDWGIWVSGSFSENNTVSNNTVRANRLGGIKVVESERSLVQGNLVLENDNIGILVSRADNSSARNNTVRTNGVEGIQINDAIGVTIKGNVVTNHTADQGNGIRLRRSFDGARVANNAVCNNKHGIDVEAGSGPATIERNRIVGNIVDGVRFGFFSPVGSVDIHYNVIADNGEYGVNAREWREGLSKARNNWWGSTSGPSTPAGVSGYLEDPVTGTLANGSGDAVSENESNAGVSNVRFDPWLTSEPETGITCPSENEPPSVSVDNDNVTVPEGDTATNNGTFADADGDNVTLNASVGNVTKNADGTWDWSFDTTDGPDQSQTVTINATDEDGASDETSFTLTVTNVPPSVTADNGTVTVSEGETASNTGMYSDPGDDTVNLSVSVGNLTKNADGTWDWSFNTSDGPDDSQTVTITAEDDDGATNQTTFELNVTNAPPSVSADNGTVTVSEGENATNTGTWADPGDDTVTLSASVGTVTKNADGTWDWTYNTTGVSEENQTVTITATDDEGASANTTFNLTVKQVLQPGEDFEADFKGCSEVWVVFNDEDQLPADATIQVYNAVSDAEETVDVTIELEDVERIPGQYDGRPVYKFNVHDYFDRDEDGDDKVLAISVGGSSFVENSHRCADNTGGGDDNNRNGNGNDAGKNGNGSNGKGR